ncbi:MAG: SDR family NAD(P)-dependent oxidoreductase [Actinomycetota bacterium]
MATTHLADKVLIVTGAAGGFGSLLCRDAIAAGAKVAALDVDGPALDELAADLSAGDSLLTVTADVVDPAAMGDAVERTTGAFGSVDVLVNNAGTMPLAFLADHADAAAAWSRCIDINLKGVLNGMIAVHDQMIEQGQGHIVNLSSIYGNAPVVGAAVYGATKAAVNTMSEAFRVETQGRIKITIVKPTGVPATGLGSGVINPEAVVGILGQNAGDYGAVFAALREGRVDEVDLDPESIGYAVLDPQHIVDQILHAVGQPLGVSLGDITIRAAGDRYIL